MILRKFFLSLLSNKIWIRDVHKNDDFVNVDIITEITGNEALGSINVMYILINAKGLYDIMKNTKKFIINLNF